MRVRRSVLDAIADHARREAPNECCGLLIGVADEILEAVPARNVADDPRRRYELSPVDHFAQIKRCRELNVASGVNVASADSRKIQVVGVYHSHPYSAAVPSRTDRELAFSDFLFLITGNGEVRAYRLSDGAFGEVRLEPIADPAR